MPRKVELIALDILVMDSRYRGGRSPDWVKVKNR